jgi:dipeptide transport system ATP-binding protein
MLRLENLSVAFETRRGRVQVIEDLSFELLPGRTLGIVGESGSGKSVTSLAIMGLLPPNARITSGKIWLGERNLLELSETELQALRGRELSMIFQDPMTSLNPSFTVGFQIIEALRQHRMSEGSPEATAIELLRQVGIPDPESRLHSYPHQLSGGMSQRVMIAISIACSPGLLIADEPTTALDVTIQAQILSLLRETQLRRKMGLVLITHDIGVVAQMADDILVMYAGHAMEYGPKVEVIQNPRHPYTQALLASLPGHQAASAFRTRLPTIAGLVPDLMNRPPGCQLNPRCLYADDLCRAQVPAMRPYAASLVKCRKPDEVDARYKLSLTNPTSERGM